MFSICKSDKDKYFIMHKLKHGASRCGAAAPGKAAAWSARKSIIVKVIR